MLDADTGHALDDRDEVCGSDCSGDAVTGDGARLEGEGGRQSPPVHA